MQNHCSYSVQFGRKGASKKPQKLWGNAIAEKSLGEKSPFGKKPSLAQAGKLSQKALAKKAVHGFAAAD